MPIISEFAAAKINLTLVIHGRRPDGYHALSSFVAFALDAGDQLTLAPQQPFSLSIGGPEGAALDGPNLVTDMVERMRSERPELLAGAFHLEKHLPVASGIGGGSADAAAAIRAVCRLNGIAGPYIEFADVAADVGADIPVCIGGEGRKAAFMTGIGHQVWRPPAGGSLLPADGLAAILVNPRVPVSTAAVFRELAAGPVAQCCSEPAPTPFATSSDCLTYLCNCPNDLQAPAMRIAPVIGEVLETIRASSQCCLARMSGSGATCFGIYDSMENACEASREIAQACPSWWVKPTRLA